MFHSGRLIAVRSCLAPRASLSAFVGSSAGPLMAAPTRRFVFTLSAPYDFLSLPRSVSSVAPIPESWTRRTIHIDCGAPRSFSARLDRWSGVLWRLLSWQVGRPSWRLLKPCAHATTTPKWRLLGIKFYRFLLCAALSPNPLNRQLGCSWARAPRTNY